MSRVQSRLLAKLVLKHSSFQDSLSSAKEWSSGSVFWRGPLLLPFLVTVFKFGLGFAEPSGSSKVVISPVLKAKLQPELVTSKHLFTFVQQL